MALAQGDWVSVKHGELIEFVLKWLIERTLLMQSQGVRQVMLLRSFFCNLVHANKPVAMS